MAPSMKKPSPLPKGLLGSRIEAVFQIPTKVPLYPRYLVRTPARSVFQLDCEAIRVGRLPWFSRRRKDISRDFAPVLNVATIVRVATSGEILAILFSTDHMISLQSRFDGENPAFALELWLPGEDMEWRREIHDEFITLHEMT